MAGKYRKYSWKTFGKNAETCFKAQVMQIEVLSLIKPRLPEETCATKKGQYYTTYAKE